jgi:plasmid stabilization system protein ParE
MTYEVYVTDKATYQLEAAARWWAQHRSVEQARRWYDGFVAAIRSLAKNPQRFPLARESEAFPIEIRQLVYGLGRKKTHRAVFAIRPDRVVVYAARHLAQDELTPDDL